MGGGRGEKAKRAAAEKGERAAADKNERPVWWSWSGSSRHAVRSRKRTACGIPKKPLETPLKCATICSNKLSVW